MQPRAYDADRVIITREHEPPVLAQIVALGRLQGRSPRSQVSDISSNLVEVSLRLRARFEQPLSDDVGLFLSLACDVLVDTVGVF